MKRFLLPLLRLGLGATFVYAGVLKIADPVEFADSVASFHLLPPILVSAWALSLPVFEVLCGGLLIVHRFTRPAALGLLILCGLFALALLWAIVRQLPIDCGCFGRGAWTSNPWLLLARDLVLAAIAAGIYRNTPGQSAL